MAIANDLMFYIFTHIETDINLDELSEMMGINKFHMHKLFKEHFGRNIYETIKSIRLQKASNLLLSNPNSTISQVAQLCGYSSQTSFIRAFKEHFAMTPGQWRRGGYRTYSQNLLYASSVPKGDHTTFETLTPQIEKMPEMEAFYIRQQGYDPALKASWQKLQTWLYSREIEHYTMVSLFHDNPAITPLQECHHVACILKEEGMPQTDRKLPTLRIAKGVYARFDIAGERNDLLRFIHWVYHEWLPQSGYETTTKPPYAIYRKNHHLSKDERFEMSFYLSISL